MGRVYNIAVNVVQNNGMNDLYLYEYPNNIAITVIFVILFKISSIFNLTDYLTIVTLFNSIIVGLSGILMYSISKKMFGNKKALMLLIILLFSTPLYLYCAIYYTDTLSMFMMLLIAYMYIIIKNIKPEKKAKKIIGYISLGVIITIGMKIKLTTFFVVIAYIVYLIFTNKMKECWKAIIPVIAGFTVLMLVYNIGVNKFVLENTELSKETKQPIEQWLYMGLIGNGGFNQETYDIMNQYNTIEGKKIVLREKIKETLQNYNCNTFIKHLNEKLKYAWTDGTYLAPEKLRREPVHQTDLHELLLASGKNVKYYKYIPQVMHMSMLIFILIGVINIIRKKNFENKNIIFYITMLGFILFLLIWENRSRYILTGIPVFMIAMLEGIEQISKTKNKEQNKSLCVKAESNEKGE